MRKASAWIIDLAKGLHAAIGSSELVHLIPRPTLFGIPQTPAYCRHLLLWEGVMVPVLDLGSWLLDKPVEHGECYAAVIVYKEHPNAVIRHGALLSSSIASRINVSDEQACSLPPTPFKWRHVACSCFIYQTARIPVLDLPWLFSGAAHLDEFSEDASWRSEGNCELSLCHMAMGTGPHA